MKRENWLWLGALIVLCAVPFFRSLPARNAPLGEDEIYWIGQTYYWHLAAENCDWKNPDWQLLPARENPVLGKFILGAGLRLNGLAVTNADWLGIFYIIAKDRPNAWGTGRDFADRQAVLARMTPAVRTLALEQGRFDSAPEFAATARVVMLVFGVVSVLAVFALVALHAGRVAAFLAALIFALHPAVVEAYTETGVDILATAFSLLAVIGFILIQRQVWRKCSWPKFWRAAVVIGCGGSLACAVGSKMNAVVVGFLGAAMCACWLAAFVRRRSPERLESGVTLAAALVVSLLVFVALNPANYPNPVAGVWSNYADQQRSLEVQKTIPAIRKPLRTPGEHVRAIATLTALHPAVFALAVFAFAAEMFNGLRREKRLPVLALWWLIATVSVTAWIPFARLRYALPVVAPSVVLVAVVASGFFRRWRDGKKIFG